MNIQFNFSWVNRLAEVKKRAKDAGLIKGDADIAAGVSSILTEQGLEEVERAAVNHWFTGKRTPSVPQFIAVCQVLNCDPSSILTNDIRSPNVLHYDFQTSREKAVQKLMKITEGLSDTDLDVVTTLAEKLAANYPIAAAKTQS